ncbi:hypothetical protein, variant [Saprolegnia diclina VS20]|uniref:Phosphodiesterase n=1 Tax=Saprolegnia diclina (strain VS20) TaxID=1156394 RepID=T0QAR7_SAPDV|nr:hypothetical protein, variant [Saprolegnia diclina VS20]EQC34954.1 hypothetical protein, variant [Saprolegnia diclina VS20]|eukprot:XP_008611826.1 hypothetical protein, variant [Saprolegnia diclina VS20]
MARSGVAPLPTKGPLTHAIPSKLSLTFSDTSLEGQYERTQWDRYSVKRALGGTLGFVAGLWGVVLLAKNELLSVYHASATAWVLPVVGGLQCCVWAAYASLVFWRLELRYGCVLRSFLALATLATVELLVFGTNQPTYLITLFAVVVALTWHLPFLEFVVFIGVVVVSSGVVWGVTSQDWVGFVVHVSFLAVLTRDYHERKQTQRLRFMQTKTDLIDTAELPNPSAHSGMELVLETLCQLRLQHPTTKALDVVLQTLLSETDLFTTLPIQTGGDDQEVGEWWRLLESTNKRLRKRRESSLLVQSRRKSDLDLQNSIVQQIRVLYPSGSQELRSPTIASIPTAEPGMFTPEWLLNHCGSGAINIFELSQHCQYPMTSILLATLAHQHLFGTLGISMGNIAEFALEVEGHYHASNPYHNAMHAASVIWDVHQLMVRVTRLKPLQLYSLLVAAAVHDVDHPGVNNTFLIHSNHPLALQYSDDSVLERMHLARAFELSRKNGCNPFQNLSAEARGQCRQMIIQLVLATDLAKHVQHVNHLKSKTYGTTAETRYLDDDYTMRTLLMMADIGRPLSIAVVVPH